MPQAEEKAEKHSMDHSQNRPPNTGPRLPTPIPETVLVLVADQIADDEVVVERRLHQNRILLFEAADDAYEAVDKTAKALGFAPTVTRMRTEALSFRWARYKPADGPAVNVGRIPKP